mmetsp:Transcript_7829/g.8965  ORF Transcript_7829/g.8965 Transcript_7829/m.8965 type:complete len:503 (-) Transcript_7829:265-1773(-)
MGGIASTIQLGLAYCCCNTTSSLCNTCFGSTSTNSSGRKRSVLLLTLTITFALLFQYSLAPSIITKTGWWKLYSAIPGLGKTLFHAWTDSCQLYNDNNDNNNNNNDNDMSAYSDLYVQCVGNAGVYRPTFIATLFFLISAIVSKSNPNLNKQAWPSKYGMYLLLVLISLFLPNEPIFTSFYLTLLRIGAMVFILIQQIILIDIAYNLNESWVENADYAESQEWGAGKIWLRLIVISSIGFYITSIIGIVLLYKYFTGCVENTIVITLTWIGIGIMTVIQLLGEEGSTLTTSVISVYSTYLAYSTVTKNPNGVCNPILGSDDISSIVIGLVLTMISLAWTGWSWTAQDRIENVNQMEVTASLNGIATTTTQVSQRNADNMNLDVPFLDPDQRPTTGLVVESNNDNDAIESNDNTTGSSSSGSSSSSLWKLNVVLALISCWIAASLTGWGSITGGVGEAGEHTAANPLVGRLNMAMIAFSQNIAICLYLWTLLAPKLFPDRDFA